MILLFKNSIFNWFWILGNHLPGPISLFSHSTIINISDNEWIVLFYNLVAFAIFLGLTSLMRMYNQELPQDLSSSLDDRSKVMIDGLPLSCQETHLSAYLSRITDGKVKDIRFVFYKEKKLEVAFVTLLDRKSAKALVSAFERRKSLNTMGQKSTFYQKIH